tara:strand:- start:1070 stop:2275 length:1206 start_codon:yes stop_codon:yes gene_type:complete
MFVKQQEKGMYAEEVWEDMVIRDRKGFVVEGVTEKYSISSYGRVWNKETQTFVAQVLTGKPQYWYVNLKPFTGKRILRRVHNIMGHTFLGEPDDTKMTIDHIDRNKYNNSLDNLRWASRKEQAINRNVTNTLDCGMLLHDLEGQLPTTPSITYKLYREGYTSSPSLTEACRKYTKFGMYWEDNITIRGNSYRLSDLTEEFSLDFKEVRVLLTKGYSFTDIVYNHLIPLPTGSSNSGYEVGGCWFPSLQSICDLGYSSCCLSVLRERVKEMSIGVAVSYNSVVDRHGFEYQGVVDTIIGHCERLQVSYQRVSTYMSKHSVCFEDAIELPLSRTIKHNINGVTKRNSDWYKEFDIPTKTANSYLNRSDTKRTFRDVLERYNIDTSTMEIYPCDGEVIMYHNPI